ncbi:MAG: ABC transporter ATP-binding protein [Actinomycetota bacterium]|nr:ABC transporter ATP-binding protein [Actinomycetota bacterium]
MTSPSVTSATSATTTRSRAPERAGAGADAGGLTLRGVNKVLGGRAIVDNLDLVVEKGELVCLLGPSGCGKTTTLRMVAGFLEPDEGSILIEGTDVTDLPPERRPTAMVFQNYALWPHMSVFDNIAFGLKLRKRPKGEIRDKVGEVLELVGLTHHTNARPARISGGEQQRVALARALVQEPKVLLLDEPLSNLDAKLRVRVREDIREIQQRLGMTTVVVTHDQDEALSISDRVAVMNGGRIEQYAEPVELYRSPATTFVGGFVGATNALTGRIRHEDGRAWAVLGDVRVPVEATNLASGQSSAEGDTISVRPEDVVVTAGGRDERSGVPASLGRVIPRGHFTEVVVRLGAGGAGGAEDDATTVRAYVDAGAVGGAGDQHVVRFRRALVYRDGHLL